MIGTSFGNYPLITGQPKYPTANRGKKSSGNDGFETKVPNEECYTKTISKGKFETCAEVGKISGKYKYALREDKAICRIWQVPGIEYRFFHAVESTEENPVLVARGVDEHGKPFEEKIDVRRIDPYNTTALEIEALRRFEPGEYLYIPYGEANLGLQERFDFITSARQKIADCNRLRLSGESTILEKNIDFILSFTGNSARVNHNGNTFKLESDSLRDFAEETKRNLELYSSAVRERMISGMTKKCSEELSDMLWKK